MQIIKDDYAIEGAPGSCVYLNLVMYNFKYFIFVVSGRQPKLFASWCNLSSTMKVSTVRVFHRISDSVLSYCIQQLREGGDEFLAV